MAPIYANKTDGAIVAEGFDLGERGGQQLRELRIGYFTGCHRKLTMFDAITTTRTSLDRQLVGQIREDHLGPVMRQELLIRCGLQRRAAVEAVLFELPKISRPGNGGHVERLGKCIGAIVGLIIIREDKVDFSGLEAECEKIVIDLQFAQE